MTQWVLARGVQGLGAGALLPLALIIIGDIFFGKRPAPLPFTHPGLSVRKPACLIGGANVTALLNSNRQRELNNLRTKATRSTGWRSDFDVVRIQSVCWPIKSCTRSRK
jgi:MFS family permease